MRNRWRFALMLAVLLSGMLAGWRIPAVGTDDAAMAHVRQTHPEFQPRPALAASRDEQVIALGLLAQGVCGTVLFAAARVGLNAALHGRRR